MTDIDATPSRGRDPTTIPQSAGALDALPRAADSSAPRPSGELRQIHCAAAETGLTTRTIRYYEEMGLLSPARSVGAYRLYDQSDIDRLKQIQGLRDAAGFSLAEIARVLEDDAALARSRAAWRAATGPDVRRRLAADSVDRLDNQVALLEAKIARLSGMVEEARARRERIARAAADLAGAGNESDGPLEPGDDHAAATELAGSADGADHPVEPEPVGTAQRPVRTAPRSVDTAPRPVDTAPRPTGLIPSPAGSETR